MKVAISGASGMLGSALSKYLIDKNFTILKLVRRSVRSQNEIYWDPLKGTIEREKLEGIDAMVNFSGKNIGLGRWTKKRKNQLLNSRVKSTLLLSKTLAELSKPPSIFLSSSAIGFYGDRGAEILNEGADRGKVFFPIFA